VTTPRRAALIVATALGVVALTACSSSSSSKPSSTSTFAAAPAAKGPAVAHVSFAGSQGAAGPVTKIAVSCFFPGYDGPTINLFGSPAKAGQSTMINVSAGTIHIRLDEGSGSTYHQRDFDGTGVTGFDATRGAQIDSTVTEVASGGTGGAGDLGAITSIKGTVGCGAQTPGSSTIKITGDAGNGPITAPPSQVRVACNSGPQGKSVIILALAKAATTPTFLVIDGRVDTFTVSVSTKAAFTGFFTAKGKGVSTPTSHNLHVDGDATLAGANSSAARTLHLVGDATCGTG
jgi:hypothetical protein